MQFLFDAVRGLPDYDELKSDLLKSKTPIACFGLNHPHKIAITMTLKEDLKSPFVLIVPNESDAMKAAEDYTSLGLNVINFPSRDFSPMSAIKSPEFEQRRIGTLSEISDRAFDVLITTGKAACERTIPRDMLKNLAFSIQAGDTLPPDELIMKLVSAGYQRSEKIDGMGQFSQRGGIIDFFSPAEKNPVRVDYWDDEIDTLSYFDIDSQRRTDTKDEVKIIPAIEAFIEKSELATKLQKMLSCKLSEQRHKVVAEDTELLSSGISVPCDRYLDVIFDKYETLLDYIDIPLFISDSLKVKESVEGAYSLAVEDAKELLESGFFGKESSLFSISESEFAAKISNMQTVFLESLPRSSYSVGIKGLYSFTLRQLNSVGTLSSMIEDIPKDKSHLTVILAGEKRTAEAIADQLNDNEITAVCCEPEKVGKKGIFVTTGSISSGLEIPQSSFTLLSYGRAVSNVKKAKYKRGANIGSLDELKEGDAVVHVNYGIGIFNGVHQLKIDGIKQDYIKIHYSGSDFVYISVTDLDQVSRYIGAENDGHLRLSKLGSSDWSKTRARVKKAVKDIAKELIALYAKRMKMTGYPFSPDCDMQRDFEQRFPFDETNDQLRCIDEIKKDMENAVPMDRLLCGDVGFGKTEVALRAAFKCILDGKQCAILVPTTILAWQHYGTATERFSGMPVNIEMLSRFRTPTQTSKIKKKLSSGVIDLIIGTHRLISSDVKFKDLGLLIIDEEQRFGVAQKEKLKELFPNVDVLTLSATPIPRTLNMALSGLRDMSSIEEAPHDRLPVQTYVMEQNHTVTVEAIQKELGRGGQVYYLHNRVESIDTVAAKIQLSFPDASVAVAHGKMSEEELSDVWKKLIEHEIDILVCTTIIETGVDVPNVNTLIIEDADRFGLAQLHQLRGRVGRSHRRAYAYLFYKTGKALSDISTKRLEAIKEFTEFGSGYKIAMRDLEIRGAGSVLGGEQHGHMEAVGYDMYIRLLSEAIAEEKGEVASIDKDCSINIRSNARIPETYITDLSQRLEMYKRIASIRNEEDKTDVIDELIDRFGEPPQLCLDLMTVALIKSRCINQGFTAVSERNGNLVLEHPCPDDKMILTLYLNYSKRLNTATEDKKTVFIRLKEGEKPFDLLSGVLNVLENSDI